MKAANRSIVGGVGKPLKDQLRRFFFHKNGHMGSGVGGGENRYELYLQRGTRTVPTYKDYKVYWGF